MAKKVTLELTVKEAEALRDLLICSDDGEVLRGMETSDIAAAKRVAAKVEDALFCTPQPTRPPIAVSA